MKFKIIPNEQTPKIEVYKPIEQLLKEDYTMLVKFISFARTRYNCAGLAANQCTVKGKRIMEPFFCIKGIQTWELILHPKIFSYQGKKEEKEERCLTWIGKTLITKRSPIIGVSYYNLKGEKQRTELQSFLAQIFQHEYDHIMGVEEVFK